MIDVYENSVIAELDRDQIIWLMGWCYSRIDTLALHEELQ